MRKLRVLTLNSQVSGNCTLPVSITQPMCGLLPVVTSDHYDFKVNEDSLRISWSGGAPL